MKIAKIFSAALICAATAVSMAKEPEVMLYFPFDEDIKPEETVNNCSSVGHIGATSNNGGFKGEALDIKPGLSVGHSGMEMQFRALTIKPAANHNPEKGTIEFYLATMVDEAEKKRVEASKEAPFAMLFNMCHYDDFGQENNSLLVRFGYTYLKGKSGRQWRLTIIESSKKENRHYKGTPDWTQRMNENFFNLDVPDWKPGEWHHIVFTWEGKNRKFYVDGKLITEVKNSVIYPMVPNTSSMVIGGRAPFQNVQPKVHCRMDELKICDAPIVPAVKGQK